MTGTGFARSAFGIKFANNAKPVPATGLKLANNARTMLATGQPMPGTGFARLVFGILFAVVQNRDRAGGGMGWQNWTFFILVGFI